MADWKFLGGITALGGLIGYFGAKTIDTKKLPAGEKAVLTGASTGATMEGLDLALGAEEGGFYQLEVKYNMEDGWEHYGDYDNEEDATGAYYDIYLEYPEVILLEVDSEGDSDLIYRQRNYNIEGQKRDERFSAEGSGKCPICKGDVFSDMEFVMYGHYVSSCDNCKVWIHECKYECQCNEDMKGLLPHNVFCMNGDCTFGSPNFDRTCESCEPIAEKIESHNRKAQLKANFSAEGEHSWWSANEYLDGNWYMCSKCGAEKAGGRKRKPNKAGCEGRKKSAEYDFSQKSAESFNGEAHTDRIRRLKKEIEDAQKELRDVEYCGHEEWNSINGWTNQDPFSLTVECAECGSHGLAEYDEPTELSWDKEYLAEELKKDSCCCGATKSNPCACMILGIMECNATCPCSLEKEKNWGGDAHGQLATALRNARIKASHPRKPLKIEKWSKVQY